MLGSQILAYRARQEEDEDDRGGDPEGAVEIGVPVQDIKEGFVGEGEESGKAAVEDG